ncbi:hypothetical protein GCM10022247_64920 [Allokutzneria multivorans]|uniref:Uncharacterized protein n=1 Tax=Allokutzneria multivorans TaxID=1142134 RepID=A0ABP7TT31_9PSEU
MEWNRQLVDQVDLAFNESTVCGLFFDESAAEARLLVEVLALPEVGPIDRDPRRVVVFSGVSSVEVILRADLPDALGPVQPLESMDALEAFFASLEQAEAMYGWSFVDVDDVGDDWNVTPSLGKRTGRQVAAHTFHWFTECGRPGSGDGRERYCLQGVINFDALRVERADSQLVPLETFVADARRWWDALERRDARLSAASQRDAQAGAARWRAWGGESVMVPGKAP